MGRTGEAVQDVEDVLAGGDDRCLGFEVIAGGNGGVLQEEPDSGGLHLPQFGADEVQVRIDFAVPVVRACHGRDAVVFLGVVGVLLEFVQREAEETERAAGAVRMDTLQRLAGVLRGHDVSEDVHEFLEVVLQTLEARLDGGVDAPGEQDLLVQHGLGDDDLRLTVVQGAAEQDERGVFGDVTIVRMGSGLISFLI